MIKMQLMIAIGLSIFSPGNAVTLFNSKISSLIKENDFDANGQKCLVPMRANVSCPVVCVPDISLCPKSVAPAPCQSGSYYCSDGTCKSGQNEKAACKDIKPVCSCMYGFSESSNEKTNVALYPCSADYKVDVPNYAQTHILGDQPLIDKCLSSINLAKSSKVGTQPVILHCKSKTIPKLTFFESGKLIYLSH